MIIDSHAHYNNNAYKKQFRYLSYDKDGYALREGDREQLFQELLDANIPYSIEPGVSLQSCEEVLQLCAEYPGRIFPAIGIHPTRSIFEKWSDRHKLDEYANTPGVVAIGEIGLDYHYKREEQHRLKQHIWFLYPAESGVEEEAACDPLCPRCPRGCTPDTQMAPSQKVGWSDPLLLRIQRNCRAVSETGVPHRHWRFRSPVGGTGEGPVGSNSAYSSGSDSGGNRCTLHPALL